MGADIAGVCVAAGMEVTLQDISPSNSKKASRRRASCSRTNSRPRQLNDAAKSRLIADPEGNGIARADVVIEAIVERLDIKQKLFADLETKMKPGAVMATNTSSLKLADIRQPLKDPGRLIGLHFFSPVPQMPLVEVVRGDEHARRGSQEGCGVRDRDRQVPADHQGRAGLPRQRRADALHVRGHEAAGRGRRQGKDRRGRARRSACPWGRSNSPTTSASISARMSPRSWADEHRRLAA